MPISTAPSEYRVEKRRASATVTLSSGTAERGCFFLASSSTRHDGPERVGDLLNSEPGFFPFEIHGQDGVRTVLYNRSHVVIVTLAEERGGARPRIRRRDAAGRLVLLSNGAAHHRRRAGLPAGGTRPAERLGAAARDLPVRRNRRRDAHRQRRAHRRGQRGHGVMSALPRPSIALFHAMVAAGASDLHLCVGSPPIVRKDGRMQPLDRGGGAAHAAGPGARCSGRSCRRRTARSSPSGTTPTSPTRFAGLARFRSNVLRRSQGPRRRVPRHPVEDPDRRAARPLAARSCSCAS